MFSPRYFYSLFGCDPPRRDPDEWYYTGASNVHVVALTKSEARAKVKAILGLARLPAGETCIVPQVASRFLRAYLAVEREEARRAG